MRHLTCSASPSSFVQFSWESVFGELSCTGYKQIHMALVGRSRKQEKEERYSRMGEWNLENGPEGHDNDKSWVLLLIESNLFSGYYRVIGLWVTGQ